MKIVIVVDGLLRDHRTQILKMYNTAFVEDKKTEGIELSLILDIDLQADIQHALELSDEDYGEFLDRYQVDIKALAKEPLKNVVESDLSNLQQICDKNGDDLTLIDQAYGQGIGASLRFFASRPNAVRKYQFIQSWGELNEADLIITSLPEVTVNFEERILLVNTSYNSELEIENKFDTLKDVIEYLLAGEHLKN